MKVLVLVVQDVIRHLLRLRIVDEHALLPVDAKKSAILVEFQALGLSTRIELIAPLAIWRDLRDPAALNVHDPEVPRLIEGRAFEEFPAFDEDLHFASTTQLLQGFCRGRAVHRCAKRHDDHDNRAECGRSLIPNTIHFRSSHACPPPAIVQQLEPLGTHLLKELPRRELLRLSLQDAVPV